VEVGLRACEDTWLLVAVNHGDAPRSTRVALDSEALPVACACNVVSGETVAIEPRQGGPSLLLRLPPHDGGVWVLYRERPFTLRLDTPPSARCPDGVLSYKVMVVNESGQPARGCHILRVAVADPAGEDRPEFGGDRVTRNGVLEVFEPFAHNDPPGRWTIAVTDPITRRMVRHTVEVAAADTEHNSAGPEAPSQEP
jgi:hypothetical protein